jgi:hypothetical protein
MMGFVNLFFDHLDILSIFYRRLATMAEEDYARDEENFEDEELDDTVSIDAQAIVTSC